MLLIPLLCVPPLSAKKRLSSFVREHNASCCRVFLQQQRRNDEMFQCAIGYFSIRFPYVADKWLHRPHCERGHSLGATISILTYLGRYTLAQGMIMPGAVYSAEWESMSWTICSLNRGVEGGRQRLRPKEGTVLCWYGLSQCTEMLSMSMLRTKSQNDKFGKSFILGLT